MKFNKFNWERNSGIKVTELLLQKMLNPAFPNHILESYEVINTGLANTNIRFKVSELNDQFLLRIYTRDIHALKQEFALAKRYGKIIPMPEFLYVDKEIGHEHYAIQKWIPGIPLYKALEDFSPFQLRMLARNSAEILNIISSQTFPKGGFFKENLSVFPFEKTDNQHPFVSYIGDCLFKGLAGKHLGEELKEKLWKFVQSNESLFPDLEPACLVQGDFNFDNILVDTETSKITAILDWEYAFSGSYLFDIGTFFRFDLPMDFKKTFLDTYEEIRETKLPNNWERMIKVQDLSNFVGLLNTSNERPICIRDITLLIQDTIELCRNN